MFLCIYCGPSVLCLPRFTPLFIVHSYNLYSLLSVFFVFFVRLLLPCVCYVRVLLITLWCHCSLINKIIHQVNNNKEYDEETMTYLHQTIQAVIRRRRKKFQREKGKLERKKKLIILCAFKLYIVFFSLPLLFFGIFVQLKGFHFYYVRLVYCSG